MSKIRVLIIDDAVVVRKVVSDTLASDPDIDVVGAASNGQLGLAKFRELQPDAVVLDIEMPVMDGLTCLREIRKIDRRTPVIMFSTLTERGAVATLEALSSGASDYVTKPTNSGSIAGAAQQLRNDLIPKIKNLVRRHQPLAPVPTAPPTGTQPLRGAARQSAFSGVPPRDRPAPRVVAAAAASQIVLAAPSGPAARVDVIAIGVSTGGPNALAELLPVFPATLSVPVVIVQHMPATFTRLLSERLDRTCAVHVVEAVAGMPLRAGEVYIAPGDFHMVVRRNGPTTTIDLNQGEPENSCRPAVDVLFRSVADVFGPNALGVVMTGMGSDGLLGAQVMHARGAHILAQDEESSVVWGMPGYVAKAGIADAVLPLAQLGMEMVRRTTKAGASLVRPVPLGAAGGRTR